MIEEFFNQPGEYWRDLLYKKKLLVFKNMQFSKLDYVKFCSVFGRLWEAQDYRSSRERVEAVIDGNNFHVISPMSNLIAPRIGQQEMPWHADIPNHKNNPFPIRTIWMVKNPNPESGLTSWLNIEDGFDMLPEDLKLQAEQIKIVQQSWWIPGTSIQEYDFIKTHPVTGRKSLRLNYFCEPDKNVNDAWIKNVIVDGQLLDPRETLLPYYNFLLSKPEFLYTHKWETYDIIVYDNWSFVHSRTPLIFDSALERLMYRTNIDHVVKKIDP